MVFHLGTYPVQTTTFVKTSVNHGKKKSSKFTKKITHIYDMMIYNFVKTCSNSTSFVRYKNYKFLTNHMG